MVNVTTEDAGIYVCIISTSGKEAESIDDRDAEIYQNVDDTFIEALQVKIIVRSVPGPVSRLTMRTSTILGILIWDYKRNETGGYPLKSFTAEFREHLIGNETDTNEWERLDPINIAPNVVSSTSHFNFSLIPF